MGTTWIAMALLSLMPVTCLSVRCPPYHYLTLASTTTSATSNDSVTDTITATAFTTNATVAPTSRLTPSCRPCTRCRPGTGAYRPCTPHHDAECLPCSKRFTYNAWYSAHTPCVRCARCTDALVLRKCTPKHNAQCGPCLTGYFMNPLTRRCTKCGYCFPDLPGLTFHLPQCSSPSQPRNFQCLPVSHPPYSPPVYVTPADKIRNRRKQRRRKSKRGKKYRKRNRI